MESMFNYLSLIVPWIISIILPVYTLRHSRMIKEIEILDRKKDREFQLEKSISEKAIEVMAESYHLTHKINRGLNEFGSVDDKTKEIIFEEVKKAREYWEKNLFYLPEDSRRLIIPLTNMSFASFTASQMAFDLQTKAFDKVSEMFRNIENSFAAIMRKYNLFDQLSND